MTNQEAFDRVVAHARAQGRKAIEPGKNTCRYRTSDGLMCFVGCLIPDEQYRPELEGQNAYSLTTMVNVPALDGLRSAFLQSMQVVHDRDEPDRWEREFAELAIEFGLTYTPPAE